MFPSFLAAYLQALGYESSRREQFDLNFSKGKAILQSGQNQALESELVSSLPVPKLFCLVQLCWHSVPTGGQ